jgi:hypothetical protein
VGAYTINFEANSMSVFSTNSITLLTGLFFWFHAMVESKSVQPVYRYFGYGSNVLPSTMKSLRRIDPLDATAAILPDYELRFDGAGSRLEPSAAFVAHASGKTVHGVLYTLTAEDFAKVGFTEGIPFAYRWQKCNVHAYVGNSKNAGKEALNSEPLDAYTLVSPNLSETDVPPSRSYLGIIKEGAALWEFDRDYQDQLDAIEEANNLIIPDGLSGLLLRFAEFTSGTKR